MKAALIDFVATWGQQISVKMQQWYVLKVVMVNVLSMCHTSRPRAMTTDLIVLIAAMFQTCLTLFDMQQ